MYTASASARELYLETMQAEIIYRILFRDGEISLKQSTQLTTKANNTDARSIKEIKQIYQREKSHEFFLSTPGMLYFFETRSR